MAQAQGEWREMGAAVLESTRKKVSLDPQSHIRKPRVRVGRSAVESESYRLVN